MNKRQIQRKIVELELVATKLSTSALKTQKAYLSRMLKTIETQALAISALEVANPGSIEVMLRRTELTNTINIYFNQLTALQNREVASLLEKVYNNTRVEVSSMLGRRFETTNSFQAQELINRADNGLTVSQRIWKNNKLVAERVNKDIGRLIYQGANPEEIKRAIAADFNISYNRADALFRTETSKFYNNAAIDSYKEAGLSEVEWLTEEDDRTCEICGPLDGKRYPINQPPVIPSHPRCRCTLLPVIE